MKRTTLVLEDACIDGVRELTQPVQLRGDGQAAFDDDDGSARRGHDDATDVRLAGLPLDGTSGKAKVEKLMSASGVVHAGSLGSGYERPCDTGPCGGGGCAVHSGDPCAGPDGDGAFPGQAGRSRPAKRASGL